MRLYLISVLLVASELAAATPDSNSPARQTQYRVERSFAVAAEPACMPAMTRAVNGDIVVVFSTEWEPFPWGGHLKQVVSSDRGETWTPPRVILKDEDPRVSYQAANGLQVLRNAELLLPVTLALIPKRDGASAEKNEPNGTYDLEHPGMRREVRLLRSSDHGQNWKVEVPPALPNPWWRFGRLLECSDGRLILPGRGWYLESTDNGKTWSDKISLNTWFWRETSIVETKPGTLLAILLNKDREPMRVFGTTRSTDGGRTWDGKWRFTSVRGKMPDILVLPDGRLLMAVGAEGLTDGSQLFTERNMPRRSFVTLFISDDGGGTWKRDVAIEPADNHTSIVPADSPVMCALENGRVLVVAQGIDRNQKDDPWMGHHAGMSLVGNVLAPVEPE